MPLKYILSKRIWFQFFRFMRIGCIILISNKLMYNFLHDIFDSITFFANLISEHIGTRHAFPYWTSNQYNLFVIDSRIMTCMDTILKNVSSSVFCEWCTNSCWHVQFETNILLLSRSNNNKTFAKSLRNSSITHHLLFWSTSSFLNL